MDERLRLTLDFVVEELFTNLVKYNNGSQPIEIYLNRDGDSVRLELVDHDVDPFDPNLDAPKVDTTKSMEERTPGGLGLHLVKAMVDDVAYEYEDRDMRIIVTKYLET